MNEQPLNIVRRFADQHLQSFDVVMLAGSAANMQCSAGSDLDVVAFSKQAEVAYRQVLTFEQRPVELFAFPVKGLEKLFEYNAQQGLPTIMRMIAEGKVVVDNGLANSLKRQAERYLKSGPAPWSLDEMNQARFQITENLIDLADAHSMEEAQFIAIHLFMLCCRFWLRVNDKWIGEGKWLKRELEQASPHLYRQGVESLREFFRSGSVQMMIAWADQIIAPYGGRLYEGFASEAYL